MKKLLPNSQLTIKSVEDYLKKSREKLSRKKIIVSVLLFLIILFAAGLRLYHFSDLLHYKLDQSRDNILVSEALKNGPASLPLMGPRADGTQLRVGPIYYYFEYVSALIFGDTPQGHAYFVAILSIASVFIFYLLAQKFFNEFISLGLTYLYSISFFLLLHARFGWNPNILPFFVIAGIYCLLQATDKDAKYPGRWFVACVVLFGVATQLHFVAFFALPIFLLACLLYQCPKFSWKVWVASIAFIFVLYLPVVVNDIVLKGYNTKEFIQAFSTKTDHKSTLVEKAVSAFRSGAEYYVIILSGNDRIWTPKIKFEKGWVNFSCQNHCKETGHWLSNTAIAFFLLSALLIIWQIIKRKKPMMFVGLFFLAAFLIFTQISIEPRFYLLVAPLPFFFLGNAVEVVWRKNAIIAKVIFVSLIILLSYTNLSRITQRFRDLENADKKLVPIQTDRIIGEDERVSLRQFQAISNYMFSAYQKNGYPVLIYSELLYVRSFMYLTEKNGASVGLLEKGTVYSHANSFVVLRTRRQCGLKAYLEDYEIVDKKDFGTFTVYELTPKADKITAIDAPHLPDSFEYISVPQQITWRDALGQ